MKRRNQPLFLFSCYFDIFYLDENVKNSSFGTVIHGHFPCVDGIYILDPCVEIQSAKGSNSAMGGSKTAM